MAPDDRDAAYIWDMLEAAQDVVELMTGKTREDWRINKMLRMAVERGLEIIGEAAGRVSKPFQDQHPEVP